MAVVRRLRGGFDEVAETDPDVRTACREILPPVPHEPHRSTYLGERRLYHPQHVAVDGRDGALPAGLAPGVDPRFDHPGARSHCGPGPPGRPADPERAGGPDRV